MAEKESNKEVRVIKVNLPKIKISKKIYLWTGIVLISFFAGLLLGNFGFFKKIKNIKINTNPFPVDKRVAFLMEVYGIIKDNYWDKANDEQLVNLYVLGTEKLTGKKQTIERLNQKSLQKFLKKTIKELKTEEEKNKYAAGLADIVLANLQPFGRSRLYSQKQEVELKNIVENKTEKDYYQALDVSRDVSPEKIKEAFEQKVAELKKEKTEEAKQKLAEVNKAYQILSDEQAKKLYDEKSIEPTMEGQLLTPDIFYLRLTKFSPTTIEELIRVTQKVDKEPGPTTLIFDLRDNVGGAIDGLPYFLGPFIGNDQYAYQFYHQGEKQDFKTKIGWLPSLVRYKKVVVLINENTQSSAEVMASVIKKYNVGILVGTKTKGWGTVEKVFEIKNQFNPAEKYSAFLVHSLTLREDGQPIEGMGVEPAVDINNKNWEKELRAYIPYEDLIRELRKLFNK